MGALDKAVREAIAALPKSILQKFLARKMTEAGAAMPDDVLAKFAEHIMQRNEGDFEWDDGSGVDRKISLIFAEEDERNLEEEVNRVIGEIPTAVQSAIVVASKKLFGSLVKRWGVEHAAQKSEVELFRRNLEARWGEGLDYLRMLLTCCREMGEEASQRYWRSKAKTYRHRRWVLERLHVRACQVADEIICLIENGFADGAMARWRTLHEISVVASLIEGGDEDLAERYILHDVVEFKRQADEFEQSQVPLGAKPLTGRQRREIDSDYDAVISRFGPAFAHPYGWASKYLNLKRPTFKELHVAAGRADSNSYYKLASFNIHASARSLFFNLSSIGEETILISGRSNAGLQSPGELTAHALALVTALYVESGQNIERLMKINCLLEIRDAVSSSLRRSERQLARDERAIRVRSFRSKSRPKK
ncbi:MAG: DUF5677 domain-containing protein [Pseudomonadota bacterium]